MIFQEREKEVINPRCTCAARVTVVVSVCLSLSTPQLTSQWFVCPRNDAMHSSSNKNQFNFMGYSESAPLLRSGIICVSWQHVSPYPVFVVTEASLLVRKANNITVSQLCSSSFTSRLNNSCAFVLYTYALCQGFAV